MNNNKPKKYKIQNPDAQELRDNDLNQAIDERKPDFIKKYKAFYDDLKNTPKTEDW